jgi:DNA-binding PadR family transcriptional regulator
MSPRKGPLGELEHLTLLAVLRLGDDAYGANVRRELEHTGHRELAIATVYVTLVRLEKKGYLQSREADPEPVRGGKAKRCYRITEAGADAVKTARAAFDRMWEGLDNNPDLSP